MFISSALLISTYSHLLLMQAFFFLLLIHAFSFSLLMQAFCSPLLVHAFCFLLDSSEFITYFDRLDKGIKQLATHQTCMGL